MKLKNIVQGMHQINFPETKDIHTTTFHDERLFAMIAAIRNRYKKNMKLILPWLIMVNFIENDSRSTNTNVQVSLEQSNT